MVYLNESLYTEEYIIEIVKKYSDMLVRISFFYMKIRSDAEDVVQDVFFKLIENPRKFESYEHEKAWLIRTTINLCKDRLKLYWFRKRTRLNDDHSYTTPEKSEVISTIMELPLKYRSIVLLFYYEGYSISEISKILHLKESTVGSQLHRARKMLKIKLEEGIVDE